MLDPNQDPKNLHKSYFKLQITNDMITSKMRLMELYSTLAYRKSIQSKNINITNLQKGQVANAKFVFELQPCGRQPQFRYVDYSRKIILLKIFKTLDLIFACCDNGPESRKSLEARILSKVSGKVCDNPHSPENTV